MSELLVLEDLITEFGPSKDLTLETETNHRSPFSDRKAWIKPPSSASSSSFSPLISIIFTNFIVDCRVFSGDGSLEHGRNVNALLGSIRFKGSVMAFRLSFSRKHHGTRVC